MKRTVGIFVFLVAACGGGAPPSEGAIYSACVEAAQAEVDGLREVEEVSGAGPTDMSGWLDAQKEECACTAEHVLTRMDDDSLKALVRYWKADRGKKQGYYDRLSESDREAAFVHCAVERMDL